MVANVQDDRLLEALRRRLAVAVGRERAVTLQALAEELGVSRREVELCIEDHLDRFPFVLVAGGCGVYRAAEAGDINAYLHSLHSRHRRMQIREATVRRKARASGWPEESGRFVDPVSMVQQELFA